MLGNSDIISFKCQVGITTPSDLTLKSNLESLDIGLGFINQINPIRFTWLQSGRQDIGFAAQHLLDVQTTLGVQIPGLVNETDPDKLGIMTAQLIPILVKAIKELSQRVTTLELNLPIWFIWFILL